MRLCVDSMFIFQSCTYITPACGVYAMVICLFLSVYVLAGLRQGGGMLVICAIFSHHCGLCLYLRRGCGARLRFLLPRHPKMTSHVLLKNTGRHSWYQSRVQRSAM